MIHRNVSERGLAFVRLWIFGIWAVYLLANRPQNFARVPGLEFDPPGLLSLLPGRFYDVLLTTEGLTALKWITMAGVLACAVGVRPWKAVAIPTVILLTIHQGVPRGLFGYINHKELGALYATYVLAFFPMTTRFPFGSRRGAAPSSATDESTRQMVMLLLTGALLIPYCLVGLYRLTHTDFSLWSTDTFAYFMVQTSYGTNWFGNEAISEQVLGQPWLLKMLAISFPIGTVVEVLAPLCIVHRGLRRFWVLSMLGLHLLTWATMDILFWENIALYPVLLADGDWALGRVDAARSWLAERSGRSGPTAPQEASSKSLDNLRA